MGSKTIWRSATLKLRWRQKLRGYIFAIAVLTSLFFISLHSGNLPSASVARVAQRPLQRVSRALHSRRPEPARIVKASALFGQDNRLYEDALRSHDRHNQEHGYELKILRERITNGYYTKPSYMLSLIVAELMKPEDERAHWIMWIGPDVILLNPLIPLDVFLPPPDFDRIHVLATRDGEGLNAGVYFLRVVPWSARMLIEVLAYPSDWLGEALEKDELAMEMVLTRDVFRIHVQYQPRHLFNSYQLSANRSESQPGDLLVHFHNLNGDKWGAMARTLSSISATPGLWEVPLRETKYLRDLDEYWGRLRTGGDLLEQARDHMNDGNVVERVHRLEYASMYQADDTPIMQDALDGLTNALRVVAYQPRPTPPR